MNIDPSLLDRVAADLASLDFSGENARIADLEARKAETQAALSRAQTRRDEICDMLAPYSAPGGRTGNAQFRGLDGSAVASALLAGASTEDAAAASVNQEELERERDAMTAAMVELRRRIEGADQAIRTTKGYAKKRVAEVVQPLADAAADEARAAANSLRACWATLEALGDASGALTPGQIATRNAVPGLWVDRGLLRRTDELGDVPREVVSVLSALTGKEPAFPPRSVRSRIDPYTTPRM